LPSKTLSRQQIFTAIQVSTTATIEKSGRDGGHLATLDPITVAMSQEDFPAGFLKTFCIF
jgi:hypothetical protein